MPLKNILFIISQLIVGVLCHLGLQTNIENLQKLLVEIEAVQLAIFLFLDEIFVKLFNHAINELYLLDKFHPVKTLLELSSLTILRFLSARLWHLVLDQHIQ